ncbi:MULTISPECIES: hypothetical protein [Pseudomonas]|uniref:Uncharacterized protein n=1 Tax=Pseudomonas coronafaciens pv. striafaciens TaxID=235276 RepID=A0A3M4YYA1_9PSED|nr:MULTISPECIES: hypothetical protein [Pseudomonas]MBI6781615.1 hypothetical protein [Pseudomonas syringae]MBI6815239.1 hypothetical protein [Pseudomonas syringae]MBI6821713.1 hypothetical protein [Pseudomonas syringae]MBP1089347.1 hypothetical protein [Pseudomonas sp. PvP007]MBP1120747.1 hypothetical protein [Pseudomonas sp. PvP028]
MNLDEIPVAALLALAVSLFGLWRAERAQGRSRAAERFLLQQTVLLKVEAARSEWYALERENNTLILRLSLDSGLQPELRAIASDYLKGQKEFLAMCIADATACAENVFANGTKFSEKKCRDDLRLIELSLEKLRRNQGVSERKFDELMQQAAAHG